MQRPEPKRGKSSEQKAFEPLPIGLKQADASEQLERSERTLLQKEAFDQVKRFEILKAADIETLSKVSHIVSIASGTRLIILQELRHLDERTKYLRDT
jgi:hypothetical protein